MNNPVLILYLEDNPRDAELVRDNLQQLAMPHELRIASDRAQYEVALAEARFDLIMSDYALPDYDGFAALALAHIEQPDAPFILISGTLSEEQAVDVLRRGAIDYVIKQNLKRLVPAVLRALSEAGEHEKRRAAETALRESEKRFMDVLYSARDAILLIEGEKFVDCNEATGQMLGYASRDAFLMRHPSQLSPPLQPDGRQSFEKAHEMMQRAITNGSHQFEWVHRRANGEDFPVEVSLTAISYGGRTLLHCLWRDITERKRAAAALQESVQMIEGIIDSMPVRVFWKDMNLAYLGCNAIFARDAGFAAPNDLIGKDDFQLVWREQADAYRADDRAVIESGRAKVLIEESQTTPTGDTITLLTSKLPLRNSHGEVTGVLGMYMDITERKRAEMEIKNEQALSHAIIEGIPGTFYMLDENGKYVRWSAYQRDEIVGKPDAEVAQTLALDTIHPDDRAYIQSKIEHVLTDGVQEAVEGRVLLRGGPAFVWLLMTGRRLIINGRPFLVGVGIDITERKHAEAKHAKLHEQFAQAQKMESVGRLAGGVAHDFNNLLMGIMGYTQLCMDKIALDHPIREYLAEITHDAERSAEITRQLLAFARKQTIAPRVLDLNDAVAGMLKLLQRLIGEDIKLAWRPGVGVRPVKLDPSQVDQILANLCVNARDAIDGVGNITLETKSMTIDADYCATRPEAIPGAYVSLAVSDDGCGMDKETLVQVFEPFFTTKGLGKGTGLGLATVYGIVKQNHGFINVYSEPGQGTTFRIYLPQVVAADAIQAASATAAKPLRGTETVLLVEDEKSIRNTMDLFLKDCGYTVLVAEDPKKALNLAGMHPGEIHLLITDVIMPDMSGRDLANLLLARRPTIKRLFISGFTADVIAQRGVLDDGVNFLSKPFGRDVLVRKVREVLEQPGQEQ